MKFFTYLNSPVPSSMKGVQIAKAHCSTSDGHETSCCSLIKEFEQRPKYPELMVTPLHPS